MGKQECAPAVEKTWL